MPACSRRATCFPAISRLTRTTARDQHSSLMPNTTTATRLCELARVKLGNHRRQVSPLVLVRRDSRGLRVIIERVITSQEVHLVVTDFTTERVIHYLKRHVLASPVASEVHR